VTNDAVPSVPMDLVEDLMVHVRRVRSVHGVLNVTKSAATNV